MVYLDNAATTPPFPEVVEAVARSMTETFGNPASLHQAGLAAERLVRASVERFASTIGAEPGEILLTSGGTESINTALRGYLAAHPRAGRCIVTSLAEHPAVLETVAHLSGLGYETRSIGVDSDGRIRLDELEAALKEEPALISLLHVNNETGAIQPMDDIAALIRRVRPETVLHLDCVQSYGKMSLPLKRWGVRMASFSAHKFHGPKGIGILYVEKGTRIEPLLFGGGQQRGLRSGTENAPLAAGMAVAATLMSERRAEGRDRAIDLRNRLLEGLSRTGPIRPVILSPKDGIPGILSVSFPGVSPESLVNALSAKGICISTVSACSSRKKQTSHVLLAMGIPAATARSATRISTSLLNRPEDVEIFLSALGDALVLLLPKR